MAKLAKSSTRRHRGADPLAELIRQTDTVDVNQVQTADLTFIARKDANGKVTKTRAILNADGGIDIYPALALRFVPQGTIRCNYVVKSRRNGDGYVKVGYALPADVTEAAKLGWWKDATENILTITLKRLHDIEKFQWRWARADGPLGKAAYPENGLDVEPYLDREVRAIVVEKESCFIIKEIVSRDDEADLRAGEDALVGAVGQEITPETEERIATASSQALMEMGEAVALLKGIDPWILKFSDTDKPDVCELVGLPKESSLAELETHWNDLQEKIVPRKRIQAYKKDVGDMPSEELQSEWQSEYVRKLAAYNRFKLNIMRRDHEAAYIPLGEKHLDTMSNFSLTKFVGKKGTLGELASAMGVAPAMIRDDLEKAGYPVKLGSDAGKSAKLSMDAVKIAVGMIAERLGAQAESDANKAAE